MSPLATAWGDAAPDAAFVAPDAPFRYWTRRAGWLNVLRLRKREWFSLIDRSLAAEETGVRTAAARLDRFIDAELARHDLPPDAVVLAGFSQGAMMVLYTGLRRAVAPRGILGFSGAMPALPRLASELRNRAPVLLVHGEADIPVPVSRSREAERALRGLGVPVELMTQPGVGHLIDPAAMQAGAAFLRRVLA